MMDLQAASSWPGEWLQQEAAIVADVAGKAGLPARLIGGVGIYAAAESSRVPPLQREYRDFDLIVPGNKGRQIATIMESLGYEGKKQFNALHGAQRQIYVEREGRYSVDVLIGTFDMCHKIDFSGAFTGGELFAPRHLLLLTKLQIVQVEGKDLRDICALLLDWGRGQFSPEFLDSSAAATCVARDWGLQHTVEINLGRVRAYSLEVLSAPDARLIEDAVRLMADELNSAPKGLGWRARARIGERVRWYELPEEV